MSKDLTHFESETLNYMEQELDFRELFCLPEPAGPDDGGVKTDQKATASAVQPEQFDDGEYEIYVLDPDIRRRLFRCFHMPDNDEMKKLIETLFDGDLTKNDQEHP